MPELDMCAVTVLSFTISKRHQNDQDSIAAILQQASVHLSRAIPCAK